MLSGANHLVLHTEKGLGFFVIYSCNTQHNRVLWTHQCNNCHKIRSVVNWVKNATLASTVIGKF